MAQIDSNVNAIQSYDTREQAAQALARDVEDCLRHSIKANDKAVLVVSGGGTPIPFFQALNTYDLPWNDITVMVADERWVPVDHDDSNEKLVREHLTNAANVFSLTPNAGESVYDGAMRLDSAIKERSLTPDVVVLGMGDDGHTASLFPKHPQLDAGLDRTKDTLCLAITESPKPPAERVTLTARYLLEAPYLKLHITGDAKHEVYKQANTDDALPIHHFITQTDTPLSTYWAA